MDKRSGFALLLSLPLLSTVLQGHPMGNFSVNHYARIEPAAQAVEILYVLDLAEIPTFELLQKWNMTNGGPREEIERHAADEARHWVRNLAISNNGRSIEPQLRGAKAALTDGAGGMQVMRVEMRLHLPIRAGKLAYEDRNYGERAGWKEIIVVAGKGAVVENATQDDRDRSQALTAYPQDPTMAPPQDTRASLEWTVASAAVTQQKRAIVAVTKPLTGQKDSTTAAVPPQSSAAGSVVRGDFLSQLLSTSAKSDWASY